MGAENFEILFSGEEVFRIIPQRPPFVFIDTFYKPTEDTFFTSFKIDPDNPLVTKGILQESGLFENIAQTAAAGNGYQSHLKQSTPVVGFIGAIKKSKLYKLPRVGNTIHTRVKTVSELMNAMVVEGEVYLNEEILLSCQLNIFLES